MNINNEQEDYLREKEIIISLNLIIGFSDAVSFWKKFADKILI